MDVHRCLPYNLHSNVGTEGTSGGLNVGEGFAIGLSVLLLMIGATLIGVLLVCLRKRLHKGTYICYTGHHEAICL